MTEDTLRTLKYWSTSKTTLFYVYFSPITYNLQYDLDGGSWPAKFTPPSTATYDASFTLKNPSKTGHTFTGWDVDGTNYPYSSGTSMTFKNLATVAGTNVAFTALWKRESYDLSLVINEGVSNIWYRLQDEGETWSSWHSVTNTAKIAVSYGLRWEAYCTTTQHWTYSGSGSSEDNPTSGTMGTSGAKFAPVPSRKTYKMTLTANPPAGGTVGTSEGGYTYPSESDAHLWATAQTGYHFVSWSDGSVANPHTITMLCATNVWANFEKNVYTITFAYRNEKGVLTTEEQSVAYGESATEPGSAKRNVNTGYVFENWDNSTWKTIVGNLNVNATYTANSYTVKFVGNGGVTQNDKTSYTQSFNYDEEKNLAANTFNRTGYTFVGWSTTVDATSSSRRYTNEELVKNIVSASDGTPLDTGATLVLYAQWTPITYKISFVSNGGTGTMSDKTVDYDEAVELPACKFTGSQPFVNWTCSADGKDYADCETVVRLASEDGAVVTMTANWGEAGRAVTFNANGGEGTMDPQSFTKNVEFSLSPNTFTKAGYTFDGWTTDSSATTLSPVDANFCSRHYPDQSLVTTNSAFTLYAIWKPNTYQVTFDANNGEDSNLTIVSNFTYDVDLTPKTALGFTPPAGLDTFVGWGTNTTTALYKADVPKMNLTPINGDHIKLYAIWGLKDCGQYSKALGCENLVWNPSDQKAFWSTNGSVVVYTFGGISFLDATVGSGDYILTYHWKPDSGESTVAVKLKVGQESATQTSEFVEDLEDGWRSYKVSRISVGADNSVLRFNPKGECQLRNVRWTRVVTDTKNVTFDLGDGTRTRSEDRVYGGETNQVVETGHVALEPTVTPPAGKVLAKWKVGDETVLVDAVADRSIEKETTFKAEYDDVVYKVIYANAKGDEGVVNPNPTTFKASETKTIGELKNADGATRATGFLGWALGRDQKIASTGEVTIPVGTTSNFVVTAVWDDQTVVETNTVSFVTVEDGVIVTNTVFVESGKNVETPTPAARAGYAFVGWDKSADAVTSDRTLTAQYEKISYPISYRNTHGLVNGNTAYTKLPQSYTVDDEITLDKLIPDAKDTDSEFLGWSLDGGETLVSGIEKGTTGELTFTALWRQPSEVVIDGVSRKVNYGETVTASTAASVTNGMTNVVCVGWIGTGSVPATGKGNKVTFVVTQPSSLTWQYQTNYWVSATGRDQTIASTVDAIVPIASSKGGTVKLSDASGTLASTEGWFADGTDLTATAKPATGWSFAHWLVDANFCSRQNEEGESASGRDQKIASTYSFTVLSPVSLTAVFTQKVYTVTFVLDDHLTRTGGGALVQTVTYGKSVTLPTVKSDTNYAFDGWYDEDGNKIVAADLKSIKATQTVYGRAIRATYALDVSVSDGCEKMGSVSGGKASVKPGTKVSIRATAKTGYVFAGWYPVDANFCSRPDATPISQSASYSFTMPSEDVAYEAKFIAKSDDWATIAVGKVESEYAPKVEIDPIAVTAGGGSLPTVKATGLPTGLKFTAKDIVNSRTKEITAAANTIYGTPTRSGVYTATITATTAGKATASTNITFVVVDRAKYENVVKTEVVLVDANFCSRQDEDDESALGRDQTIASTEIPGKTTGQGVYAAGKKVTLKATANKGYVFSGWYDANINLVSRLSSLALVVPDSDLAYTAAFVTTDDDAASISANVNGMEVVVPDSDASETSASTGLTVETNVSAGVYLEWPVFADALSATSVAVSGLPSGLKFTAKAIISKKTEYDESGKRVYITVTNVPAMTIYGRPTAASKVNARTGEITPSTVKVTVTTAGKNKAEGTILLTVDAIPTALVGTYTGGLTNEPIGSASVTVAKTGKITGKWISEGLTWTLSAAGFDRVDANFCSRQTEDGSSSAGRDQKIASTTYVATNVTAKCGKLVETMTLVFTVNDLGYGTVDAIVDADSALGDAESLRVAEDQVLLFSATYVPWKTDAELKDLAKELRNAMFDVTITNSVDANFCSRHQGKVGANGTVSVKGTFTDADETSASTKPYTATVSSTLVPLDPVDADVSSASEGNVLRFELFLYYPYKKNKFDGYATRLVLSWDGAELEVVEP